MEFDIPRTVIIVAGKPVTKPAVMGSHYWLTDTVIAFAGLDALAVIEATTGKELGRKARKGKPSPQ
jgi:hypothetical protein